MTNDAGDPLLMQSPHGWRLPSGPAARGRLGRHGPANRGGAEGGKPALDGVERVTRIARTLADTDRKATTHDVVAGTATVTGAPVAVDPTVEPWDELAVDWFGTAPEAAYWEHGDTGEDIRRFVA